MRVRCAGHLTGPFYVKSPQTQKPEFEPAGRTPGTRTLGKLSFFLPQPSGSAFTVDGALGLLSVEVNAVEPGEGQGQGR